MKKDILLASSVALVVFLTAFTGVYAFEEKMKLVTISEDSADITGDGENETIMLKGVPYQDENSYLKEIFIEVQASNDRTFKIPLESGSKASLELVDLNHDGLKDLFVNVDTGGSGGIVANYLYSIRNFSLTNLTVPDPLEVESSFLNGYKAKIKIKATGMHYLFNLMDRNKYYEQLGLYHNGKLNEPTELDVNPYSTLIPVMISNQNYGLKGIQRVTGLANADTIAYIESLWVMKKGKWLLERVEVKTERGQN